MEYLGSYKLENENLKYNITKKYETGEAKRMIKNNCSKFYLTLIVLSMVIVLSGSLVAAEIEYPVKNDIKPGIFNHRL